MMTTTTDNDNNLTSASNAIDDMISMSVFDHDPNNQNQTSEAKANWSPRFVNLSLKTYE